MNVLKTHVDGMSFYNSGLLTLRNWYEGYADCNTNLKKLDLANKAKGLYIVFVGT